MSYKFRIHLLGSLLMVILLSMLFFVSSASPADASSQNVAPLVSIPNWTKVALVFSEILAFLPTKFKGIAHGLFGLFTSISKKKWRSNSQSK